MRLCAEVITLFRLSGSSSKSLVSAVFIGAVFIFAHFQNFTYLFGSSGFHLIWQSKSLICAEISGDLYYWLHLCVFSFYRPKKHTKQGLGVVSSLF